MSKLEQQLRMSLIEAHCMKAQDFVERAKIAINPSVAIVLLQHAEEHMEDAERLRDEMQQAAS